MWPTACSMSEREWEFMRQHTIVGERIVASASSLGDVASIVRSSHAALGRRRLPRPTGRRRHSARRPHHRGLRRLRRDDDHTPVPASDERCRRHGRATPVRRTPIRPTRRRSLRARRRAGSRRRAPPTGRLNRSVKHVSRRRAASGNVSRLAWGPDRSRLSHLFSPRVERRRCGRQGRARRCARPGRVGALGDVVRDGGVEFGHRWVDDSDLGLREEGGDLPAVVVALAAGDAADVTLVAEAEQVVAHPAWPGLPADSQRRPPLAVPRGRADHPDASRSCCDSAV